MSDPTPAEIEGDKNIAIAMMATAMEENGAVSLQCVLERDVVARSVAEARAYLRAVLGIDLKKRAVSLLDELEDIAALATSEDLPASEYGTNLFRAHQLVQELRAILKGPPR